MRRPVPADPRRNPCCSSDRRATRPGRISCAGGYRSRKTSPIRSTHGRVTSSARLPPVSARERSRPATVPGSRSSNGRCAQRGCDPRRSASSCIPNTGSGTPIAARCCSTLRVSIQAPRDVIHLCDLCDGKPCLKSCPVDAYSASGFAYQACRDHVRGPSGGPCRDSGCLDRNACPYGTGYRYAPEAQAFHMAAFVR